MEFIIYFLVYDWNECHMSILPISNPLVSNERAPRVAIISDTLGNTLFLQVFLNSSESSKFIISLHVTSHHSSLIEWISIPSSPLDVMLTLLRNVSGIVFISVSSDIINTVISKTCIDKILVLQTNCILFKTIQNSIPEIHIDFNNSNHILQAQPIIKEFLDQVITQVIR